MYKSKLRDVDFIPIIIGIIILSFLNVIDVNLFLTGVNADLIKPSMQDITIYIIYGLNSFSRVTIMDILRFSIPFLLFIAYTGTYMSDVLEKGNFYINIIRYKSLNKWLIIQVRKLVLSLTAFFMIYYLSIIIISTLYTNNLIGLTNNFYSINPHLVTKDFYSLLMYQYLLSIGAGISLILVQLFTSLKNKNINSGFTLGSTIILLLSALGKYNIINPIMMSKHNKINYNLTMDPIITISFYIVFILIMYLLLVWFLKSLVRRNKL